MKTKICSKCGIEKELSKFSKHKDHKDGLQSCCKKCKSITDKKYQDKNKAKIKINKKQYYEDNKEYFKQKSKEHRENNLDYYKDYNKEYREKPENKDRRNKQLNDKYYSDIIFKLTVTLRNKLNAVLKNNSKHKSALKLLGCTVEELKRHLESQFKDGMTWKNHSQAGWHIDHIKPCILFDLSKPEEQLKYFHYTNLQPL